MPLYEYKCDKCGIIEVRQAITDAPLKTCPNCNSNIEKQISVTGKPKFNGSGFYETDYSRKTK
ncbi:CxxC_CxxC_SSSS, putative regulatory protein, FmdB family [uncultured Caudovirales phage]|uniref:CxxC_CxxC_SSSS, putative regulatory protein, FmdB family n=1 Tax=uncultured Caudovirales phage TaxID=2100421 RepID=A0A6J5MBY2_9CAUD|nr:CxxC_CxxC_SSSS, putative regulatory protein, FmdB family [uncultured Caudovirales phage]